MIVRTHTEVEGRGESRAGRDFEVEPMGFDGQQNVRAIPSPMGDCRGKRGLGQDTSPTAVLEALCDLILGPEHPAPAPLVSAGSVTARSTFYPRAFARARPHIWVPSVLRCHIHASLSSSAHMAPPQGEQLVLALSPLFVSLTNWSQCAVLLHI